jgi:FtsZ-binding cell division protein ZapB
VAALEIRANNGTPGLMQDLNKLIDELLARELRPNTREDLGEFRQQIAAGTLSADDDRYIRGLHERVVGGGVPKAKKRAETEGAAAPVVGLQAELSALKQREQALVAERDQLQSTVAALRQELEALKSGKS